MLGLDAGLPSAGFNRSCGERRNRSPDGIVVIQMVWWEAVLFFAVVIFAIYSPRKQRRYAKRHGGEGHGAE